MRLEQEINHAIDIYSDTIRRIGLLYLKNEADMEDVFQTVFLKYATSTIEFKDEEHEKAWFIRVTINQCKDVLKSFFKRKVVSLDDLLESIEKVDDNHKEVLEAVLSLPKKYREVVYLHYYEGYTAFEIGRILNKNVNTVYTLLNRCKKLLKDRLGGDLDG